MITFNMITFKQKNFTRAFSFFTGLLFLNMSFFLAEVCLLDFQDREMIENVAKMIINGGVEEERDTHAGSDGPVKIFSMQSDCLQLRHSSLFLIASRIHHTNEDHYLHADHSEIESPPPDFRSIS